MLYYYLLVRNEILIDKFCRLRVQSSQVRRDLTSLQSDEVLRRKCILLLDVCNTIIYSCLCGSRLESVKEGKGEIIYHFRQTQFWSSELRKFNNNELFKVYYNQVGLSGMFVCHTLGLVVKSVAQGCMILPRWHG
jgi:hypothetical protein